MKRFTRNLLPVIILVALIIALAALGLIGELLASVGNFVIKFFVKNWDYALVAVIASVLTSLICTWLDDKEVTGNTILIRKKRVNKGTPRTGGHVEDVE